jgi:hypothetical protein
MTLEYKIADQAQQQFDIIKQHTGIHTLLFEPTGEGTCFIAAHHPAMGATHLFGTFEHRVARRIVTLAKEANIQVQII